jgi:hypothetical protein
MIIARLGDIALVETQVAIAFGASVQPLIRITARVRITVTNNAGLEINWLRKSDKFNSFGIIQFSLFSKRIHYIILSGYKPTSNFDYRYLTKYYKSKNRQL